VPAEQAPVEIDEAAGLCRSLMAAAQATAGPAAWLIADALRGYLVLRAYAIDWLAVAQAGLAAAEADGDLRAQAAAQAASLTNLGAVHQELGRLEQAANYHSQALALDREAGSHWNEAADRANLGETLHALGRLDQAFDHLTTTLAVHREVGDRAGEANCLRALAAIHLDAGYQTDALHLADAAIALARDTGERRIEAEAMNVLAATSASTPERSTATIRALGLARETSHRYP
jgi:tetratricopeptide (TPR) repeat protein